VGSIPIARSNIQKQLREGLIFHIFQNYNFAATLHGKCGQDLLNRNLSRVPRRHRLCSN